MAGLSRPAACAILDDDGSLVEVTLIRGDEAIAALAEAHYPRLVAIDCPLALPSGLCCLEAACPCTPSTAAGLRSSELAVRAMGYGLYHTTKRSIIRAMVYRGMALRRVLEAHGVRVVEVYPYATKRALFGVRPPKKTTPEGVRWLRARLEPLVPGLAALARGLDHDELDAIVCAHTGLLLDRGLARAVGDERDGPIVVPYAVGARLRASAGAC